MITWTCEKCGAEYFKTTNPSNMARTGVVVPVVGLGEVEFRIHTGNTHRQICQGCELKIYHDALTRAFARRERGDIA